MTVAKKMVFGEVGIDMVAGPSELTIICDGDTNPDWIAMDLFSQAEHDEQAQSILIATDGQFIDAVQSSIEKLLPRWSVKKLLRFHLTLEGFFCAKDLSDAAMVSNLIAPEHLGKFL
ncbi:MAG: hypothetical protein CM1200mP40_13970 [Gammaproteobacteria bacterium]|nr:MAG: hypothetical protein CM1200mP40_13970 [Gammaproteobacteria bacterium]